MVLGALLTACGGRSQPALRLQILENSVPVSLLKALQDEFAATGSLRLVQSDRLLDLFELLKQWHQIETDEAEESSGWLNFPLGAAPEVPTVPDLMTLGDYWLRDAVQQGLIQPLNSDAWDQWDALPRPWRRLVQRNAQGEPDQNGQVWAAPYRWTSLAIAYRVAPFRDLGWQPKDWDDLWRPELAGQIALPENARTVIGIALKRLGEPVNSGDVAGNSELATALEELHRQVRVYSSDAYLQPLVVGDIWVAVGWMTDIAELVKRDRRFAAVVPASGTILSTDLWVRPVLPLRAENAANQDEGPNRVSDASINQWINFFWQPDNALQFSQIGTATSPVVTTMNREDLPRFLRENSLLLPPRSVLEQSEFLEALPGNVAQAYQDLWVKVRQTG